MAGEPRGPFREQSLERLSSPERLDQLLRVTDRKSWLPLAGFAVLVLAGVLWTVAGSVPVTVEGRGIIVRPREVVELQAPAAGYLTELRVRPGELVEPGGVVATIAHPDLEKQLELARDKAAELGRQAQEMLRLSSVRLGRAATTGEVSAPGEHLAAARELARALRDRELEVAREERERLSEQLRFAHELTGSLERTLDGRRRLHADGVLSREALDTAEQDWVEALAAASGLDAAARRLLAQELEVEERYAERLQQLADREREIAAVEREIARLVHLLVREGRIVSDHAGRLLELSVGVGSFLAPGQRIGTIARREPGGAVESLSYFTVRDGKRIERGSTIHVTPDTVERQRHGSIVGTVIEVAEFPASLAEAESSVGNRGIAEALLAAGFRIRVHARHAQDERGRLVWTSSGGPGEEEWFGTTASARVAVEHRRPIGFVLPWLKETVGVE